MKELNFPSTISQAVRLGLGEFIPREEPFSPGRRFTSIEEVTYDQLRDAYDLIAPENNEVDDNEEIYLAERLKTLYTEDGYINDILLRKLQDHAYDSHIDDLPHAEALRLISNLLEESPELRDNPDVIAWVNDTGNLEDLPSQCKMLDPKIRTTNIWLRTVSRGKGKPNTTGPTGNYGKHGRKKGPKVPDKKLLNRQLATIQKEMDQRNKTEEFYGKTLQKFLAGGFLNN